MNTYEQNLRCKLLNGESMRRSLHNAIMDVVDRDIYKNIDVTIMALDRLQIRIPSIDEEDLMKLLGVIKDDITKYMNTQSIPIEPSQTLRVDEIIAIASIANQTVIAHT